MNVANVASEFPGRGRDFDVLVSFCGDAMALAVGWFFYRCSSGGVRRRSSAGRRFNRRGSKL